MTKTLLIVHHTPSPFMQEMFEAVLRGATDPEIEGVEVVRRPALSVSPTDMLEANGYLLGSPANLGYMSGALKLYFGEYPSTRFRRTSSNAYDLSALRECNAARAIVRGWLRKVVIRPARVLGSRAMPSCMNIETRS
jgi:hypothetical protein